VSEKQIAIIILAAGKGTRMKSALPKVLHTICGKPMIEHVLDVARVLEPARIVTVLSENMKQVEQSIKNVSEVVYQTQQLGTADAVKPALEKLKDFNGKILILYADTPLIEDDTLEEMLYLLDESDVVVLGFVPSYPSDYGRLVLNEAGELEKIVEAKDATEDELDIELCNSGVIAVKSDTIKSLIGKISNNNAKGEYYLTDIIELVNKSNKKCLHVQCPESEVLGINNRIQLSEAEFLMQNMLRNYAMMNGATLIDPESVYFSYDTKIGKDVLIQPNVWFGKGVVIDDNVQIRGFSHIEDAKIASGSIIGPFARIRPGTEIENNARIGNFVEIKKSKIGKGAKISHLTYIGDSEIGEEANIGAGTVTCNYDGENKYKTKIGAKAFIGSNTAIVAPVTVGDEAFIGAGSTITKDVAGGSLAVARGRQINKENWAAYKNNKKKVS